MKNIITYSNRLGFVLGLCVMVALGCSCSTSKPKPDPLAGFHVSSLGNLDANKAITDDYEDYIRKLSPKEKAYLGPILYFENAIGQHAVQIETDINGKDCWYHVLFYDKDNKRIKVVRYFYGRYIS